MKNWKLILKGAKKSWTIISAVLLAILGAIQDQVETLRAIFLNHTEFVLVGVAIVMALLRIKTTTSLAEKAE